ncbi:type 2 lanthipeptide synthetase LanM family protein [Bacillus thuringiensis]|nr:type 2 lanthipeptide synthetase LanM family protein [Bacillus thuringiensis]
MNNYMYRALTLGERKKLQLHNSEKVDLEYAIPFWTKLLKNANQDKLNEALNNIHNIDTEFISKNFDIEDGVDFQINDEWFQFLNDIKMENIIEHSTLQNENRFINKITNQPFSPFFKPYIESFEKEFFDNSKLPVKEILSEECKLGIVKHLYEMLFDISHKTLILEINTLRMTNELKGKTSEERYESFCDLFQKDSVYHNKLVEEYPVLFRLIANKILNFKNFLNELLSNYILDKKEIEIEFNDSNEIQYITNIKLGSGDSHKKGRTVSILELDNDNKIIYKPRSLSIDVEFQKFLEWVNEKSRNSIPLKVMKFIDKEIYGWSEFIETKECNDEIQLQHFYNRVGQLLAIVHVMNATDFHYENLIANGEYPVLIDLESLFHHTIMPDHELTKSEVVNKALMTVRDSVLSTGLIPGQVHNGKNANNNFDVSGISGGSEQIIPFKVGVIENHYSDEIKIEKQQGILLPAGNLPKLKEKEIDIVNYLKYLNQGFEHVYSWFIENRDSLADRLKMFADQPVRRIFKNTLNYAKLLRLGYHPDFLRNQIDREILFYRLWEENNEENSLRDLSIHEIQDMLEGDIPYFTSRPNENKIWSSNEAQINNFYYKNGLDLSIEKINTINLENMEYQLSIINSTFSAAYSENEINLLNFNSIDKENTQNPEENLLESAKHIADILIKNAIKHEGIKGKEYCWTSMVLKGTDETSWVYSITGPGLYDGNSGISLFFAYLWKITKNEVYKEAAYAAFRPIRTLIPHLPETKGISIGSFLGVSGVLYTFHHLAVIFDDREMLDEGLNYAKQLEKSIPNDRIYDLIGGSAGAIFVLMNLYEHLKEEWLLELATKAVQHLKEHKIPQSKGLCWPPPNNEEKPYISYSHGNAGIIAALTKYYKYSKDEEIIPLISEALIYENSFYSESKKNWYCVQTDDYPTAWCHGAAGILLGRSLMKKNGFTSETINNDITHALETTLNPNLGANYSLCHGDLGIIDILFKFNEYFSNQINESILDDLIQQINKRMFSGENEIKADLNSVGLMNGIAGIGFGLLRLYAPNQIPSILALDSPKIKL